MDLLFYVLDTGQEFSAAFHSASITATINNTHAVLVKQIFILKQLLIVNVITAADAVLAIKDCKLEEEGAVVADYLEI